MKHCVYYILAVYVAVINCEAIDERIVSLKHECGFQENSIDDENNNQYPWIVVIPLKTRTYNPAANIECVGALISDQYVITSSTCLQFVVSTVKFSEFYLSELSEHVVEIDVEKWTSYEKGELALLKLATKIEFANFIRPICLPFDEHNLYKNNPTYHTASWSSSTKSGITVRHKRIIRNNLVDCQNEDLICLKPIGNDTICSRDEGSPIMYFEQNKWILHGVLNSSFDKHSNSSLVTSPAKGHKITQDALNWIMNVLEKY